MHGCVEGKEGEEPREVGEGKAAPAEREASNRPADEDHDHANPGSVREEAEEESLDRPEGTPRTRWKNGHPVKWRKRFAQTRRSNDR